MQEADISSLPPIVQAEQHAYIKLMQSLNDNLQKINQPIEKLAVPAVQANSLFTPLHIRSALLARYNRFLLIFAQRRIQGTDYTEIVQELIKLQIQIEKISDVEKAAADDINAALRGLQQNIVKANAEKIDDLFSEEEKSFDDNSNSQNEEINNTLDQNELDEFQIKKQQANKQKQIRKLSGNLAALELNEAVGDMPIERLGMDALTHAAMEYEDENDKKLSKRKLKELKKDLKVGVEPVMLEANILQGMGDLSGAVDAIKKDEE